MLLTRYLLYASVPLTVAAQSSNLAQLISEIPPCSIDCMVAGLSSSPQFSSDPKLTCRNNTVQASMMKCITDACTYVEQGQVALVKRQLCQGVPIESRSWLLTIVGLVFVPMAVIAVVLRCYSRYVIAKHLGYDDLISIVAALPLIPILVMDVYNCLVNGFARHYWDIDPLRIVEALQIFYASEILYMFVITLVRVSVLFFYLRVFPGPLFRTIAFTTMGLNVAAGLATIFAVVFQCSPVAGAWNKTIESKCLNITKLAYAIAGIGLVLDIWIIVLPTPNTLQLHMNKKKKLGVLFMFSLGSVAGVISAVRLKYLISFSNSLDQTWNNVVPAMWSILEICVATICSCLPALRAIMSQWFPNIFNFDTTVNKQSSDHSKQNYQLASPTSSSRVLNSRQGDEGAWFHRERGIPISDDDFLFTIKIPPAPRGDADSADAGVALSDLKLGTEAKSPLSDTGSTNMDGRWGSSYLRLSSFENRKSDASLASRHV